MGSIREKGALPGGGIGKFSGNRLRKKVGTKRKAVAKSADEI